MSDRSAQWDARIEALRANRDELLVGTVARLASEVATLHRENAELRDAMLGLRDSMQALSNRIEAVTRAQSGLHSVKS